jgi:hypothetical protein
MLVAVSAASAEVTITAPTAGQVVGPATAITGSCSQRAFLVVYTEVSLENGDAAGTVPGIRHWTNDDNSFAVLISTARIYTLPNEKLTYLIHVKAYSSAEKSSGAPDLGEAQVTCYSK